jgi:Cu-Zn family superoxide dismutase
MLRSHSSKARYLLLTGLALALAACGEEDEGTESPTATATLAALGASGVTGNITLTQGEGSVTITGSVMGLAPNTQHGFHLHEVGNCGDTTMDGMTTVGGAAGGHWNPAAAMHGDVAAASHLGDLGNITADAAGVAMISVMKAGITIGDSAVTDAVGHAVIVHANPDDLVTQPVGNAGGRIACGVIQ